MKKKIYSLIFGVALCGSVLFSGCDNYFKKEVITEKSTISKNEGLSDEKIVSKIDDLATFTIEKKDIEISDGTIKVKLNLDIHDNWYIYSDKHLGNEKNSEILIGKPFKVDLKIQDALGEYQDFNDEILETNISPESITIIKKTMMADETKEMHVKIFQPKTNISVNVNDSRITKDSKILMIIDGAMCEKEKENSDSKMNQGEICIPINKSIPLN